MSAPREWEPWMEGIPFLQFPPEWKIQILPSFGGVASRFVVINARGGRASVFLDLDQSMTIEAPCWEVNDEHSRFAVDDTKGLLAAIRAIKP